MKTSPYVCHDCGHTSPRWFGRCPECGGWGSAQDAPGSDSAPVVDLSAGGAAVDRTPVGMAEVDRVLGGGLVPGEVVLLAGEPGIGKSTLVLQLMASLTGCGVGCLLASGEESLDQVGLRADRLGATGERLRATASCDVARLIAVLSDERPDVLIVDSIQTLTDPLLEGPAGSLAQVRECSAALARAAKLTGTVVILVGHVTKEGSVAGPKTLEHLVDAVLYLEGERTGSLRLLRATKNRFGPCDETGVFTMNGRGLLPVPDPSSLLLGDRRVGVPGSIVFPCLEGTRPVLVEIQALVSENEVNARRVAIGLDAGRLTLMLAVLSRDASSSFAKRDVFAAAAGGLSVREPAADLAVCMAAMSARHDHALDPAVVAMGEVGLGGEVRKAPGIERRLAEAARMGFRRALVPRGAPEVDGISAVEVADVHDAFRSAAIALSVAAQGSA